MSRVHIISGGLRCGKSLALAQAIQQAEALGIKVITVSPNDDLTAPPLDTKEVIEYLQPPPEVNMKETPKERSHPNQPFYESRNRKR